MLLEWWQKNRVILTSWEHQGGLGRKQTGGWRCLRDGKGRCMLRHRRVAVRRGTMSDHLGVIKGPILWKKKTCIWALDLGERGICRKLRHRLHCDPLNAVKLWVSGEADQHRGSGRLLC